MIGVLTILIPYAIITSNPKIKSGLDRFWKRNFKWVFYFFCITFAFIHILNYELNLKHLLLLPLITLPKLVSAITYGYVRMHYGFIYSLGLHMFWNSLGFVQIIYFSGGGTD
jgi:membrane protease YdiL (CAAX protease family)